MFNQTLEIGDAEGEGHNIKLTLFDEGSLVITSFNPDTESLQQVVLMPQQWRAVLKLLIDGRGKAACPYHRAPNLCEAD